MDDHAPATLDIPYVHYLDPSGAPVGDLPAFARDLDVVLALYRAMLLTQAFDAKAEALQRTGRLGTFAVSLGQEAVSVGVGAAMHPDDVLVPSFREQGTQLWRGVTALELLLFWGGDTRGSDFAGPREDFPVSIPVASHTLHAAGVALAMRLRREARAVVCVLGDGGTSKGDFYEALNLTGVWDLPVVYVVNNNQWAISTPRESQTRAETLAQKGLAAGIPGVQVDGNDVIAVRDALARAIARAREESRPAIVEALTYRLGDHTTSDDASRYRDEAVVERHRALEPVGRLERYLTGELGWDAAGRETLVAEVEAEVEAAAQAYLATPPEPAEAMFAHLYATLPRALEPQRDSLIAPREAPGA